MQENKQGWAWKQGGVGKKHHTASGQGTSSPMENV